ncbi:MAG: hypothetical protein R6U58_09210 [Bacteroidales bacterium]
MKTVKTYLNKNYLSALIFATLLSFTSLYAHNGTGEIIGEEEITRVIVEFYADYETETETGIENWMHDITYWYSFEDYIDESSIEIEDWMMNASYWNSFVFEADFNETVYEEAPEVEDWMLNFERWNIKQMPDCAEIDRYRRNMNTINLYDWMKDTGRWNTGV